MSPPPLIKKLTFQTGMVGLEPTTFEVEARRSIQLSYIPKVARVEGLEPTTSASEAQRSIH
jgi:hypothetical protein